MQTRKTLPKRILSWAITLAMVLAFFPAFPLTASAAHSATQIDLSAITWGTANSTHAPNWTYTISGTVHSFTINENVSVVSTGGTVTIPNNQRVSFSIHNNALVTYNSNLSGNVGNMSFLGIHDMDCYCQPKIRPLMTWNGRFFVV